MDKTEIIASLMENLSQRFSQVRNDAEHDMYRHEGASRELLKAANNIVGLSTLVDDDIDKGRYDLEVGQRVKNYILRASQMLVEQAKHEGRNQLIAQGRAQGVLDLVAIAQKRKDEERRKEAEREAKEQNPEERRPVGVHPGDSLKTQRTAEEVLENVSKSAVGELPKKQDGKTRIKRQAVPKRAVAGGSLGGKDS